MGCYGLLLLWDDFLISAARYLYISEDAFKITPNHQVRKSVDIYQCTCHLVWRLRWGVPRAECSQLSFAVLRSGSHFDSTTPRTPQAGV